MTRTIPTSLGLLTLSVFASGCSDANRLASALEKVCKAECECPESMEIWNEVSNCKDSCKGYSIMLEAFIEDEAETEPCGDFGKLVGDMKRCAQNGCGASRDECVGTAYYELYECWEFLGGYDYSPQVEEPTRTEVVQQLMKPIPGALDADTLHSAGARAGD